MQAPLSRSRVSVLLQLSTIAIFLVYLAFQIFAPQLSPGVDLNLTLNSRTCSSVTARFASPSFGSFSPETIQLLELSPIPSTHSVTLTPATQTVMVEPCPIGEFTLTALSLSSSRGSIDYALEPGDLQCYGCKLDRQTDGSVSLSKTSTQPALVINNIHKKAPFLLPTIFRPGRYLPPLLFLCLFLIFLFPVITSRSSVIMIAQTGLVLIYLVSRWSQFRSLFPPPRIGPEKIVGYSQFVGLPPRADTYLFIGVLLTIPLIILLHQILKRLHFRSSNVYLISTLCIGLLIYVLENTL